jgi:uncharacterized SAM-binding protein YcdF (DUF218 family)
LLGPNLKSSRVSGALAIFILLGIIGFKSVGDFLYSFEPNIPIDKFPPNAVIICLAGGKGRIEAAFDLYRQRVGSHLLIVGAGPKASLTSLLKTHAQDYSPTEEELKNRPIIVETESRNTLENSYYVSQFLAHHPAMKDLILITSGYHMKRARLMLEQNLREPVKVIPHTPPTEVNGNQWWGSSLGIEVTAEELVKYFLARVLLPRI